jgi:hypothetical protein
VRTASDGTPSWDFGLMPMPPAPITTIAWRLTHLIDLLKEDRCATQLGLEPDANAHEIWITTDATEALDLLDRAFTTWRGYLEATDAGRLLVPVEGQRWADPLTFALHIIDELIHHAAEVGVLRDLYAAQREDREPTLAELASRGSWDDVVRAVAGGADVNPPGVPASPLHHAAGHGRVDVVRALVEHGADTAAVDDVYHVTPLVWAQTMSTRMGGPNAIGSDYDAVIGYLGER